MMTMMMMMKSIKNANVNRVQPVRYSGKPWNFYGQ